MTRIIRDLVKRDSFKFNDELHIVHKKYRNDDSPLITTKGEEFFHDELEIDYQGRVSND